MNREQAGQIARKHHLQVFDDKHASIAKWVIDAIMEAVAVEREECARVCEEFEIPDKILGAHPDYVEGKRMIAGQLSRAIRARGTSD